MVQTSGMYNIFRLISARVCYTFAIALFSILGAVGAIPGVTFVWATIEGVTFPDFLKTFVVLGGLMMFLAALSHLFLYGLARTWGKRWELPSLRELNDQIRDLSIPQYLPTEKLLAVSGGLETLPLHNALTATLLTTLVVVAMGLREFVMTGLWMNSLRVFMGGVIAGVPYFMLSYLITELMSADRRRETRRLLALREAWTPSSSPTTLYMKLGFILVLMIINMIITYGISTTRIIASPLTVLLLFSLFNFGIGVTVSVLIFRSIMRTLSEIRETAFQLSEGRTAQLITSSLDREFIQLEINIYRAAKKIVAYQDELKDVNVVLERKVDERTAQLQKLSITDGLTGCFNRAYLDEHLLGEIKKAERHRYPLSVIMADLDFFKKVNDTYGHQAGDHVLKTFVECIDSLYRKDVDWVAHYGGEEFLIVIPGTDVTGAAVLAERIRQAFESLKISLPEGVVQLTASFGVTGIETPLDGDKLLPDLLIREADRCLYAAKTGGKNRVISQ